MLAYYKSQEEVGLGSRGSVKMACCEISGKSLTYKPLRYIKVHKATRWTIRHDLMLLWFKDLLLSYTHKISNPLTPKIALAILLSVCHAVLVMLVWRIWYWIILSPNWYFSLFLSLFCLILY